LPYEIIWSQAVAIKVYNISSTRIAIDNHITRSTKTKEIALVSRFLKIIPYTYDRPFVTFTYFSEGIPARYKLKPFALLAFLGNSRKLDTYWPENIAPGSKRALHLMDLQTAMKSIANLACEHDSYRLG